MSAGCSERPCCGRAVIHCTGSAFSSLCAHLFQKEIKVREALRSSRLLTSRWHKEPRCWRDTSDAAALHLQTREVHTMYQLSGLN